MAHTELYERLGFEDSTPTSEEIKKRYRKLVKDCHPDKFPDDSDKTQKFKFYTEAYEILRDPKKRAKYDQEGQTNFKDEEAEINSMAIQHLVGSFHSLIENIPLMAFNQTDIKTPLFSNIGQNRTIKKQEVERAESLIAKYEIAQARLKRNKGTDIFAIAAKERIELQRSNLKMLNFATKVLDRMEKILKDYEYDFTQAPQSNVFSSVRFITTSQRI